MLCKRFKSFEGPRLQKLVSDLTNLRKYNNESIVDYITSAEDMHLNLSEVDESTIEKIIVSILSKGFPREFERFEDKTLDELKGDLTNFESEKRNDRNTEKSESVFFTELVLIVTRGGVLQNFVVHNNRNPTKRNLIQK